MAPSQVTPEIRLLAAHELQQLREAQRTPGQLSQVVSILGLGSMDEAWRIISHTLGLELIDISKIEVDLSLLQSFPLKAIHRYGVFPLYKEGDSLVVVTGSLDQ